MRHFLLLLPLLGFTGAPSSDYATVIITPASSDQTGMVEIQATRGAARLLAPDAGDVSPAGTRVHLPARLALPAGSEVTLRGADALSLRVGPADGAAWTLTGPVVRLRATARPDGRVGLVALEATEGRVTTGQP